MQWSQRCIVTLLLGFAPILARAESVERVALVVGNSAYPRSLLVNPLVRLRNGSVEQND